jgi:hypothetical protein
MQVLNWNICQYIENIGKGYRQEIFLLKTRCEFFSERTKAIQPLLCLKFKWSVNNLGAD